MEHEETRWSARVLCVLCWLLATVSGVVDDWRAGLGGAVQWFLGRDELGWQGYDEDAVP